MNSLSILILRFKLSFTGDTPMLPFIGNTIRGALGQALYTHDQNAYSAVFKTEGDISAPNAFSLSAPYPSHGNYTAGESFEFQVRLFGKACAYSDSIIKASYAMNAGRLSRTKTGLVGIDQYDWKDEMSGEAPICQSVKLDFITPTEFLTGPRKLPLHKPDFAYLIDVLFGRISDIFDYYGEREFIIPYALTARKPKIRAEYNITPVDINSNNQPIRGFTGQIYYYGDLTRYVPYFALGSILNVGKKTTRACGEYRIAFE